VSFPWAFVDEGRGLVFTPEGDLETAEILASKARLLADPARLSAVRHAIVRLDGVTRFSPTSEEIRAIAEADTAIARHALDVTVAVVAPTDALFGMSRMWEVFAEGTAWRISVFRTLAEAETWLRAEASARA
jgi:hypothetical protein